MKKIDNQISEYFCSSEVCKLLESKGCTLGEYRDGLITHVLALEWLRVNFGIWISIELWKDHQGDVNDDVEFRARIQAQKGHTMSVQAPKKTPQEATDAALKYVLEELI